MALGRRAGVRLAAVGGEPGRGEVEKEAAAPHPPSVRRLWGTLRRTGRASAALRGEPSSAVTGGRGGPLAAPSPHSPGEEAPPASPLRAAHPCRAAEAGLGTAEG